MPSAIGSRVGSADPPGLRYGLQTGKVGPIVTPFRKISSGNAARAERFRTARVWKYPWEYPYFDDEQSICKRRSFRRGSARSADFGPPKPCHRERFEAD